MLLRKTKRYFAQIDRLVVIALKYQNNITNVNAITNTLCVK